MLQGADIVCLSSIDWSFNHHNPQEVALALAAAGNRVLFVENTGVRRAMLRDLSRLSFRLRNWWRARGGVRRLTNGIDVLPPLLLPFPYSRAAVSLNRRILSRAVRAWMGETTSPLIIITFLPTPLVQGVIDELDPSLVVYYCLDRLALSSPAAGRVVHSERKLLAEADLVLVTSEVLYRMAAELTSRLELLVSGVHVDEYVRARRARAEPHKDFEGLAGPIVGFVGSLRNSTDVALLASVAKMAPDLQFVLAGPRFVDLKLLAPQPNIRLLDAIDREDVIDFMVRFDVGVLPYVIDQFTEGIMPVKLKEYLAAGLPVVATPLPEVRRFEEQHPGLVRFAGEPQEFVAALREALADVRPEAVERRIAAARQYDWSRQMARITELIEQELARLQL